jgi:hypothetical protein
MIEQRIRLIRGQRVMVDSELAAIYGVDTRRLNEQTRRNLERFPADFAFQLTEKEFADLMSQTATSSSAHGGRRKLPWAFTEQGVAMLSSVLRSPMAVKVNIEIMRAFVRIRRLLATPGELVAHLQQLTEMVHAHDGKIKAITDVINKMLEPPPEPPRGKFGFHPPEPKTDEHTKESK